MRIEPVACGGIACGAGLHAGGHTVGGFVGMFALMRLPLALLILCAPTVASARFECVDSAGKVTIQQAPCGTQGKQQPLNPRAEAPPKQADQAPMSAASGAVPKQAPSKPSNSSSCYTGPRGGTYTITRSGKKNYAGC